jgi:hypothetical protein
LLPGPGWPLSAGQVRNEVPALKFETGTGTFRGHPARTSPAGICSPTVAEKAAVTCNRLIWLSGGHKTVNRVLKASGYRW